MPKYRVSQDVIAEFRDDGSRPAFWENRWRETDFDAFLQGYDAGQLGELKDLLVRHLPRNGPILEAGCGRGQYVCGLAARGYDVSGLDFSEELIASIQKIRPNLNVSVGNVLNLPQDDASLAAYLSFGVIEHFWDDSDKILQEAHRVLRPDGVAFVSVPHLNENLNRVPFEEIPDDPGQFYQFYYTNAEFDRKMQAAGFRPVEYHYYSRAPGLRRAFPAYDRLQKRSYLVRGSMRRLLRLPMPQSVLKKFSHMVMCVAHKA